jgi:hypothetical protein
MERKCVENLISTQAYSVSAILDVSERRKLGSGNLMVSYIDDFNIKWINKPV